MTYSTTYWTTHIHGVQLGKFTVKVPDLSGELLHQGTTLSWALRSPCWESSLCSCNSSVGIIYGSFADIYNLLMAVGRLEFKGALVRGLTELAIDVVAALDLVCGERKAHFDCTEPLMKGDKDEDRCTSLSRNVSNFGSYL